VSPDKQARELRRTITLPQAVALYTGAVVGAGVLILPGVAASRAGPASLVAWTFDGLLGVPIALTFATLAARFPDAGGVSIFATRAFGPLAGMVVGWFYFLAAAAAQALVVLTGAHYAADAIGWGRGETFGFAAAILVVAVLANLRGLRLSARLQLVISAAVAIVLLVATVAALPDIRSVAFHPFAPHGWSAVGQTAVLLFFAFFGWEAITHLSSEFRDPAHDVRRATFISVGLVTSIYLGVAFVVIGTATYGTKQLDRVAVAHLLGGALGLRARVVAAGAAIVITLGTANAFVAATSRLGYALARDHSLPRALRGLTRRGVPAPSIGVVAAIASSCLVVAYLRRWGAEAILVVPTSLVIVVYIVGMASGVRLLAGWPRFLALIATVLCLGLLPFADVSLVIPIAVAIAAVTYRRLASPH
jgi:amino acid efflux transporter